MIPTFVPAFAWDQCGWILVFRWVEGEFLQEMFVGRTKVFMIVRSQRTRNWCLGRELHISRTHIWRTQRSSQWSVSKGWGKDTRCFLKVVEHLSAQNESCGVRRSQLWRCPSKTRLIRVRAPEIQAVAFLAGKVRQQIKKICGIAEPRRRQAVQIRSLRQSNVFLLKLKWFSSYTGGDLGIRGRRKSDKLKVVMDVDRVWFDILSRLHPLRPVYKLIP